MDKESVIIKRKANTKEWLLFLSFVILPLIQFLIFYVFVNINSILMSFKTYGTQGVTWGFDNFRRIFSKQDFPTVLNSLRNSGIFFLVRVFIGMTLGLLFSYYIFKKMPGHNFFISLKSRLTSPLSQWPPSRVAQGDC